MENLTNFYELSNSEITVLGLISKYFPTSKFIREHIKLLLYNDGLDEMKNLTFKIEDLKKLRIYKEGSIYKAFRNLVDKGFLHEYTKSKPHLYKLKMRPKDIVEEFHRQLNELFLWEE